jgi:hypothetical protein
MVLMNRWSLERHVTSMTLGAVFNFIRRFNEFLEIESSKT